MYAFEYQFFPDRKRISLDEFMDKHCSPFIGELIKGGQACDSGDLVIRGTAVRYWGACSEKNSLSPAFHTKWAARAYRSIIRLSLRAPKLKILGFLNGEDPCCVCSKRSSLILCTTFLKLASPIDCGRCGRHVPLYRLPRLTYDDRLGVSQWEDAYKRCDGLFIGSGVGERFGYRQAASFSSALSREGYELCRGIEARIKLPVYYE